MHSGFKVNLDYIKNSKHEARNKELFIFKKRLDLNIIPKHLRPQSILVQLLDFAFAHLEYFNNT